MKKLFVPAIWLLVTIVLFVSFSSEKKSEELINNKNELLECFPYVATQNEKIDDFSDFKFHKSKYRKDIFSFDETSDELKEIRKAVKSMQALSSSNPKSWAYQTNIHGKEGTTNKLFGSCEHNTAFFLAWHRVYLYYFECILRSYMTGKNTVANKVGLPYWDFLKPNQNKIPKSCWTKKYKGSNGNYYTNPLYNAKRDEIMNSADGSFAPVIADRFNFAVNRYGDYFSFQTAIENAHGAIHTSVGGYLRKSSGVIYNGDMFSKPKAANDILFWLLHANVDRLWQKWLDIGGGNCDPNENRNKYYYDKIFTFYNENGTKKIFTGKGVMQLADSLHYAYDDFPTPIINNTVGNVTDSLFEDQKNIIAIEIKDLVINRSITGLQFGTIKPPAISYNTNSKWQIFSTKNMLNANRDSGKLKNIHLLFDEIIVNEMSGGGVVEVYINPPKLSALQYKSPYFAGLLDIFTGISKHSSSLHDLHEKKNPLKLNIDRVVEALNLTVTDLSKAKIFFVKRGNYLNNIEQPSKIDMIVKGISIVQYY